MWVTRLRTFSPVASSSRRARSANASIPIEPNRSKAAPSSWRLPPRGDPPGVTTRRTADASGQAQDAAGYGPGDRLRRVQALGGHALAHQSATAGLDSPCRIATDGRCGRNNPIQGDAPAGLRAVAPGGGLRGALPSPTRRQRSPPDCRCWPPGRPPTLPHNARDHYTTAPASSQRAGHGLPTQRQRISFGGRD